MDIISTSASRNPWYDRNPAFETLHALQNPVSLATTYTLLNKTVTNNKVGILLNASIIIDSGNASYYYFTSNLSDANDMVHDGSMWYLEEYRHPCGGKRLTVTLPPNQMMEEDLQFYIHFYASGFDGSGNGNVRLVGNYVEFDA